MIEIFELRIDVSVYKDNERMAHKSLKVCADDITLLCLASANEDQIQYLIGKVTDKALKESKA